MVHTEDCGAVGVPPNPAMSEEMQRDLGRLEAKVDLLLTVLPQHNERLTAIERWKWRISGALAAVAGAVATLTWFVNTLIDLRGKA